jgi:hypothetical protein
MIYCRPKKLKFLRLTRKYHQYKLSSLFGAICSLHFPPRLSSAVRGRQTTPSIQNCGNPFFLFAKSSNLNAISPEVTSSFFDSLSAFNSDSFIFASEICLLLNRSSRSLHDSVVYSKNTNGEFLRPIECIALNCCLNIGGFVGREEESRSWELPEHLC